VHAHEDVDVDTLTRLRWASGSQLLDVGPGGEGITRAREDEGPRGSLQFRAQFVQRGHEVGIDRVLLLRAVQPGEYVRRVFGDRQGRTHHCARSRIIAVPCPTPTHIVASPYRASSRSMRASRVTRRREPEEPSGWPRAIAPPSVFTRRGSNCRRRMHARAWAAKASLSSIAPMSSVARPARARAFSVAGTGPSPITSGARAAAVAVTIRARGLNWYFSTAAREARRSEEEPSLREEEFPAVTTLPPVTTGRSSASAASDVSGRGPSSAVTVWVPRRPRSTVMGRISSSKWPAAIAPSARWWLS